MTRRGGSMGIVRPEVKKARRAAHRAEWERREHEPWEEWNERVPSMRVQQRMRLVEKLHAEGKRKPRARQTVSPESEMEQRSLAAQRRYAQRKARQEHRSHSARKYGQHLTDRCRYACHDYAVRFSKLLDDADYLRQQDKPDMERQLMTRARHALEMYERCERRCYDASLGRKYRGERGFEITARRPSAKAADLEMKAYRKLLKKRDSTALEERRRRLWEEGMEEYSGPILQKAAPRWTEKQKQNAIKVWKKTGCKRLPKSEKAACLRATREG